MGNLWGWPSAAVPSWARMFRFWTQGGIVVGVGTRSKPSMGCRCMVFVYGGIDVMRQ